MPAGSRNSDARAARVRARAYEARQQLHDERRRRRTRDNVIAAVVGGVLILGVVGGQVAFYTLGPGAPAPSPSPSPTVPATDSPAG